MSVVRAYVLILACALAALSSSGAEPVERPIVAAYTNDYAILAFDGHGAIRRLADRATGKNMIRVLPAAEVVGTDGVARQVSRLTANGNGLRLTMDGWTGELELSIRAERWGFAFRIERCSLKGSIPMQSIVPLRVHPTAEFDSGYGYTLNGASSASHSIVLRSYGIEPQMSAYGNALSVKIQKTFNPVGQRFALVLAPYGNKTISCLKSLTLDSGDFHTTCGGAWSLESPENRRSYLFSSFSRESIDDWIDLAERGGFSTLHASGWWKTLGHYTPNPEMFPNGESDLKACIDRANAAGISVGTHTLCSGIQFSDPWVTPECNTNLLALYTYTLAEPLAADAKELVVREKPGPRHHLVTAYFSNGNILRVGSELMTYEAFTTEPPYRFTGVKRGVYGTRKIGTVSAGTRIDYVYQHFMTLFPDPKTPFGVEMARHLCDLCNRMGFSLVYHDGAEPFSRYDVALNRLNFARYLDQSKSPVQIEASTWNSESWPYHSRIGASDHPVWAVKWFHLLHLRNIFGGRRNNYLSGQLGWWNPRLACDYAEGHYIDDMEYFAAKNAAHDFAMSIQGVSASSGPLPLAHDRMMTLLGWYERARLARAFTPAALKILRNIEGESRLRQDATGAWMLAAVTSVVHRVSSADFRNWTVSLDRPRRASLRLKALYGAEPYSCSNAVNLVGANDIPAMKVESSKPVRRTLSVGSDPERGKTLRIAAENVGGDRAGAWMKVELAYAHPYRDVRVGCPVGGGAFGFWLKGDGSGALLNLQLASSKLFVGGVSDHMVKIDFTGWRYVKLLVRERDAGERHKHCWPDSPEGYALYRQTLNLQRIEFVRLFLIEVPAKGRTEIELSQVKVLPTKSLALRNVAFTVGGTRCALPFDLRSGDYAELDEGVWTRYSLRGDALACAFRGKDVALAAGVNACRFSAESSEGDPRAEIAFFIRDEPVPAFVANPEEPELLDYEAVKPLTFDPAKGFSVLPPVRTRPGEDARLEFTVYGAVKKPSVRVGDETVVIPVEVAADAKLVLKDGVNWQVVDRGRKVLAHGSLAHPLPLLKSGDTAVFSAASGQNARFSVVKRYGCSRSRTLVNASTKAGGDAKEPWAGCAVRLSPEVMWACGGFGTAMAFDGKAASAEVVPTVVAKGGWTVTAWVRAGANNAAKWPWTLMGDVKAGAGISKETWTFVAVCGDGEVPAFRLGMDGSMPFEGFVDDLTIWGGKLAAEKIDELSSDAEHVEVVGYQDDGTGGVVPIRIVPQ